MEILFIMIFNKSVKESILIRICKDIEVQRELNLRLNDNIALFFNFKVIIQILYSYWTFHFYVSVSSIFHLVC